MKDSQRLSLYRMHIDTFRQWLGHEFPMVDHVLATLKETVDGGSISAGTPSGMEFCTINGLREQLRRQAAPTQGADGARPVPQILDDESHGAWEEFERSTHGSMSNRNDLWPVWDDAWEAATRAQAPDSAA